MEEVTIFNNGFTLLNSGDVIQFFGAGVLINEGSEVMMNVNFILQIQEM
ncbi:MAG: hypothetical protein NVSMB44_45510 [Ktedonobacteraceae bacterium]